MKILKNKNAMGGYSSIAKDSLNTILFVTNCWKLRKHWRHTSMFLKNLITHFALLSYVVVILREDYSYTFRYWVKDDNSRHQREKIAPIFHKCQLQRKLNNSENIFVDNREPQCKYRKLPLISPSPPPPLPPPLPPPQLYNHLPVNIKIHRL